MSVKSIIEDLIDAGNEITGEERTDLTAVMQDLKDGYGPGGSVSVSSTTTYSENDFFDIDSITTDGNQFFDFAINLKHNSRVVLDFQMHNITAQTRLFGYTLGVNHPSDLSFDFYLNGNKQWAWSCQNNIGNWQSTNKSADKERHILDFNAYQNTITIDNGTVYSGVISTSHTNDCQGSSKLAWHTTNEGTHDKATMTIFSVQIYEGDTLVNSFVPKIHKRSGVVGLFDEVSNQFLINCGQGILKYKYAYGVSDSDICYIDYIKSKSDLVVDTLIQPSDFDEFEIKCKCLSPFSKSIDIFGVSNSGISGASISKVLRFYDKPSNKLSCATGNDWYNSTFLPSENIDYVISGIMSDNQVKIIVNGQTVLEQSISIDFSSNHYSVYLMGMNYAEIQESHNAFLGLLYYAKFKKNSVAVCDFKPCAINDSNLTGIYDTVNDRFYTSFIEDGFFFRGGVIDVA